MRKSFLNLFFLLFSLNGCTTPPPIITQTDVTFRNGQKLELGIVGQVLMEAKLLDELNLVLLLSSPSSPQPISNNSIPSLTIFDYKKTLLWGPGEYIDYFQLEKKKRLIILTPDSLDVVTSKGALRSVPNPYGPALPGVEWAKAPNEELFWMHAVVNSASRPKGYENFVSTVVLTPDIEIVKWLVFNGWGKQTLEYKNLTYEITY